jgi:hypothetical protein
LTITKTEKRIKIQRKYEETSFYQKNIQLKQINMSTSASTQTILTIIKDEFAKVKTEGTLSPTKKPTNWSIVITEKALLNAMRMPSPPPEEIQCGLATLYNTTFPTIKEYQEFTVNHLVM